MTTHRSILRVLALLAAALGFQSVCQAEATEITVRVIARDAKFIGTSMGGVRILVRDADSGELLADGLTRGETGDTDRLMKHDHKRGSVLATPGAAQFSTTLDLDEPRLIEISASGPQGQRQAANRVSATQWVVPGKHLTGGDGWVLEMPGFVVDILQPPTHVKLSGLPRTVDLRANVTLMCGCPVEPAGIWDANRYEVRALIARDGKRSGITPLVYAGKTSQFSASLGIDKPGTYEATVYAYDAQTGNTGLDRVSFIVAQ